MRSLRRCSRAVLAPIAGWLRYGLDRWVVLPAADALPRRWALRVADAAGLFDLLMPTSTSKTAIAEARVSTGAGRLRAFALAARRLGGPRRELVVLRRLRRGREHPRDWKIVEINRQVVQQLIDEQRSLVVVCGHFDHAVELAVGNALIPRLAGKGLWAPVPAWRFSPGVLRERLQNHLLFGIGLELAGGDNKQFFPPAGDPRLMLAILDHLSATNGGVRIFIDAAWEKPQGYRRPFAGAADRGFATGAARIARLGQCPVVLAVTVWAPDGSVRVEWGPLLDPPGIDDEAADQGTMDRLIDALEIAVGRYPLQYLHPIGSARHWDASAGKWQDTTA